MAAFLKFYAGAKPGKKRKSSLISSDERAERKKQYEKSRPERKYNPLWKTNRPWLELDEEKNVMFCQDCRKFFDDKPPDFDNLQKINTFITGCSNFRLSSVVDHKKSKNHVKAHDFISGKEKTPQQKLFSEAGKALQKLREAEKNKLVYLFRNAHAVAKNNRPLTDFIWLCEVDKAKQLDLGNTYLNNKAAVNFIGSIAKTEIQKTLKILNENPFFSFIIDGSMDISGNEQETIYVRSSKLGVITERFLNISSPNSSRSLDLLHHVEEVFHSNYIDTNKLIAMSSDGASNMTGAQSGLATLLRENINSEIINVHCLCHRLELAFRDVIKNNKLYDKLMTLLIGLYYFYTKSYKNRKGLKTSIAAVQKGVFPTKVTGTRWLPHLMRAISSFLRTYKALEAHLSTISHSNAKGEGLLKLMLDKQLMAFVLFLQDALEPAMRLSLKLQKSGVTLSESLCWVDTTIELLMDKREMTCDSVSQLIETGKFDQIELKGNEPILRYADGILTGFCDAIRSRFQTESRNVFNAMKILNIRSWPSLGSPEFNVYGIEELSVICEHFQQTLTKVADITAADVIAEWNVLKKIVSKQFTEINMVSWENVFKQNSADLSVIMLVFDLMLTVPSTSVLCETAFSQLKLLKTSQRNRLESTVLNNLMMVKLESPKVADFNPEASINNWLLETIAGRKLSYGRSSKTKVDESSVPVNANPPKSTGPELEAEDDALSVGSIETAIYDLSASDPESEPESDSDEVIIDSFIRQPCSYNSLDTEIHKLCDSFHDDSDVEEVCLDFQTEQSNWDKILLLSVTTDLNEN